MGEEQRSLVLGDGSFFLAKSRRSRWQLAWYLRRRVRAGARSIYAYIPGAGGRAGMVAAALLRLLLLFLKDTVVATRC